MAAPEPQLSPVTPLPCIVAIPSLSPMQGRRMQSFIHAVVRWPGGPKLAGRSEVTAPTAMERHAPSYCVLRQCPQNPELRMSKSGNIALVPAAKLGPAYTPTGEAGRNLY